MPRRPVTTPSASALPLLNQEGSLDGSPPQMRRGDALAAGVVLSRKCTNSTAASKAMPSTRRKSGIRGAAGRKGRAFSLSRGRNPTARHHRSQIWTAVRDAHTTKLGGLFLMDRRKALLTLAGGLTGLSTLDLHAAAAAGSSLKSFPHGFALEGLAAVSRGGLFAASLRCDLSQAAAPRTGHAVGGY